MHQRPVLRTDLPTPCCQRAYCIIARMPGCQKRPESSGHHVSDACRTLSPYGSSRIYSGEPLAVRPVTSVLRTCRDNCRRCGHNLDATPSSTSSATHPARLRPRFKLSGGTRWLRPSCSLRQPPSSHFIPQHLLNGFSLGDQATHAETGGRLSVSASLVFIFRQSYMYE